jgi:two-component system KDP operon response regulator KdpE
VLLVEDDRELRATLREALAVEGYEVIWPPPAWPMRAACCAMPGRQGGIDLVLLDLGLPDGDGEALLADAAPAAHAGDRDLGAPGDGQKIRLLDAGADDYLVKPFGLGELLARMRVALRHRGTARCRPMTRYEARRPGVDLAAHRVQPATAQPVHLTPTEFKLLARLVRRPARWSRTASCWPTCGVPSSPSTPTTCACTWASCAPSSRPIRPSRSCC